ncbi:MAG TPA: hypothetical protein VL500_07250 [Candidatus Eisenbacteria bacterium]|jgi:hypothetical protein|nr:hypothetical protein [Candidatus Eisenbacteria bacterium]
MLVGIETQKTILGALIIVLFVGLLYAAYSVKRGAGRDIPLNVNGPGTDSGLDIGVGGT